MEQAAVQVRKVAVRFGGYRLPLRVAARVSQKDTTLQRIQSNKGLGWFTKGQVFNEGHVAVCRCQTSSLHAADRGQARKQYLCQSLLRCAE